MENIMILIVAIIAGMATYVIANILNKGPVFASAVVTLISGIIFPHFFPLIGSTLMVVAACASYAGMVAIKNVPNLWEMVIVSSITGLLFIIVSTSYVGVGGRLGTISALACFTWIGFKRVFATGKLPKTERYLYKAERIKDI